MRTVNSIGPSAQSSGEVSTQTPQVEMPPDSEAAQAEESVDVTSYAKGDDRPRT